MGGGCDDGVVVVVDNWATAVVVVVMVSVAVDGISFDGGQTGNGGCG